MVKRCSWVSFAVIFLVCFSYFSIGGNKLSSIGSSTYMVVSVSQYTPSNKNYTSCSSLLKQLQLPFPAIIIDLDLLRNLETDSCRTTDFRKQKLKIAVSLDNSKSINQKDYQYFDITPYETHKGQDYMKLFGDKTRAIPLIPLYSVGKWFVPKNLPLFTEYWRRSPMIECLGLNMKRTNSTPYLPVVESLGAMSSLSKLLISLGINPYLNGGTLLGWYRECGIIPHTKDFDMAVDIGDYNHKLLEMLRSNKTEFFLYRTLGRPNDTFEITVYPHKNSKIKIDIFFMYNNGRNESWVGGTGGNGQKYRYIYPLYDPYCSADILGHHFWVTCRPNLMLETEYGKDYRTDHPSKNFSWNTSHKNIKMGGKWNKTELKEIYKEYG